MLQIVVNIVFASLCGLMLLAAYRNIFHQKGSDFAPAVEPAPDQKQAPVYPNRVSLNEVIQAEIEGIYQSLGDEWDDHYLTAQRGMLVVAGKVSSGTEGIDRPPLSTPNIGYSQFVGQVPVKSEVDSLLDSITLGRDKAQSAGWYFYAIPHHMSSVFGRHRQEGGWSPFVDRHIAHLKSGYFAPIPSQFVATLDDKVAYRLINLNVRIFQAGDNLILRGELIDEYHDLLRAVLAEQPDTMPHRSMGGLVAQNPPPSVYP